MIQEVKEKVLTEDLEFLVRDGEAVEDVTQLETPAAGARLAAAVCTAASHRMVFFDFGNESRTTTNPLFSLQLTSPTRLEAVCVHKSVAAHRSSGAQRSERQHRQQGQSGSPG